MHQDLPYSYCYVEADQSMLQRDRRWLTLDGVTMEARRQRFNGRPPPFLKGENVILLYAGLAS